MDERLLSRQSRHVLVHRPARTELRNNKCRPRRLVRRSSVGIEGRTPGRGNTDDTLTRNRIPHRADGALTHVGRLPPATPSLFQTMTKNLSGPSIQIPGATF